MARPKQIRIDEAALLRGVAEASIGERDQIQADIREVEAAWQAERLTGDWHQLTRLRRELGALDAVGVTYDLDAFCDRLLTASERLRAQQALRRMEAAGLVAITGKRATHVRLTEVGWASLGLPTP